MLLIPALAPCAGFAADAPSAPRSRLPASFDPSSVRESFARHIDTEVLPVWIASPIPGSALSWALNDGIPAVRLLRLLYDHGVALERLPDHPERQRIRSQYAALTHVLVDVLRDPQDGLFFTAATADGTSVFLREKRSVDQAYAIYVFAEMALRLNDDAARSSAVAAWRAIERAGHDDDGYIERADLSIDAVENAHKTLGTTIHVAIGLSRLAALTDDPLVRIRRRELRRILLEKAPVPESDNAYDRFTRTWEPVDYADELGRATLYGHNAELVWAVIDVDNALGIDPREDLPWLTRMAGGVIRNGVGESGAVYIGGPLAGPAADRSRLSWWPHTEVLLMLVRMYELTRDEEYWRRFVQVARFTFDHFVDAETGAWRSDVGLDTGETADGAGRPWFAGLHVIRMLVESDRALATIVPPPSP